MNFKALGVFVVLSFAVASTFAITYQDILKEEWNVFKQMHQKVYRQDEEDFRFKVFMENKHMIAKHNKMHLEGHKNYSLEVNHFADLMSHEFVQIMNGYKGRERMQANRTLVGSFYLSPSNVNVPDEVDWRKHNLVTPVKDQGACGSCWSFSTTGALESQHARKTGKLVSLSEQNLIDCSGKFGNNGCNGGLMDYAFQYIKQNHGIDTENSYPYEARQGHCRYTKSHKGADDTGFVDIESGNEEKLKEASATVGAISIAIDASHPTFQFYKDGVYDEPQCSSTELDHGVLLIGYGTDEQGRDFWLVKNSWSTKWGLKGLVKMARNKNNQCGVATAASYPLV